MTTVHAYASLPHYAEHLAPILAALPDGVRGGMWAPMDGRAWGPMLPPALEHSDDVFMVAGLQDAQHFAGRKRLVYVEHGAGQTYVGAEDHGSYSGGNHDGLGVRLYIAPSETVAARWRARGSRAVAVGCPRLDARLAATGSAPKRAETVVFTWHWWCELAPEAQSAFPHYETTLPMLINRLRDDGVLVMGHGHPRYLPRLARFYQEVARVPWVRTLDEAFDQAPVLVADNTSALYEAAACGIPTVVVNAPWYRRHVEHGLRFWSHVPGPQVDDIVAMYDAITAALIDPTFGLDLRERAADHAYAHRDGKAGARAAAAIMEALA